MTAMTEVEKTMRRLKVTMKVTELSETPARGFSNETRTWRVTLSRELKDQEKPSRFTLTMIHPHEPTIDEVMECLAEDTQASAMTLWDFAQEFTKGKTNPMTEKMYKTCKRANARIKKFFGDSWAKFSNAES